MEHSPDALAGIAGMFGGLTRSDLQLASAEIEFKQHGSDPDVERIRRAIDDALLTYHLVETEIDDETILIPGPTAFPLIPAGGDDLPHILDAKVHEIDRSVVGEQLLADLVETMHDELSDEAREQLNQLSYDLEAWASIDASPIRNMLDEREE